MTKQMLTIFAVEGTENKEFWLDISNIENALQPLRDHHAVPTQNPTRVPSTKKT